MSAAGDILFMETDLSIRLHLYATAAERLARSETSLCADAISCWRSATASQSTAIICSHTRVLRAGAEPNPDHPGRDDLDVLIAGRHDKPANASTDQDTDTQRRHLPLSPGNNSAEILARGAEGVIILKDRNA